MSRIQWPLLVIVAGSILPTARLAMAQATVAGPTAAPSAASASNGASGAEQQSSGDTKAPAGSSASGGGGYTWHDKSRVKHRKMISTKVNPKLAQAKGPEFAVVADGTTRITVQLSKRVEYRTEALPHRIVVNLDRAQVAVFNDRNPLVTTHFSTPVEDARLVQSKTVVRLVVDLKATVTPQVTLKDSPAGSSILEVVLPKWTKQAVTPDAPQGDRSSKYKRKTGVSKKANATHQSNKKPLP